MMFDFLYEIILDLVIINSLSYVFNLNVLGYIEAIGRSDIKVKLQ